MIKALITGANSGIGEALAEELAKKGVSLILVARDDERLRLVQEKLSPKVSVQIHSADLADRKQLDKILGLIASERPDVVVNNAGIGFKGQGLLHDVEKERAMLNLNVAALMELTLEAVRHWTETKSEGCVLNISSIAAMLIFPGFSAYSASKAFVNVFSKSMDLEGKGQGIRVLCACPGLVKTRFHTRTGSRRPLSLKNPFVMSSELVAKRLVNQLVARRSFQIVGKRNRLLIVLSKLLPLRVQFFIRKKMWE